MQQAASKPLGIELVVLKAQSPGDFAEMFRSAAAQKAEAMLVLSPPAFNSARKQLVEATMTHRLPAIMPFSGFAEDGGLMAYGPHLTTMFRQAGDVMVKVLRGARPGEIPIERPTRFELVVNSRTAKALGLPIPASILLRAERVIE